MVCATTILFMGSLTVGIMEQTIINYSSILREDRVYITISDGCGISKMVKYLQGKPCNIYRLQGNPIVIIGFSLQILQKNPAKNVDNNLLHFTY